MKGDIDVTNTKSPLQLVLRDGGDVADGGGSSTASGLERFGFTAKEGTRKRKQVGGATIAAADSSEKNEKSRRERLMLNPRIGLHPTKKGQPKENCIRYLFAPYRAVQHGKRIAKVRERFVNGDSFELNSLPATPSSPLIAHQQRRLLFVYWQPSELVSRGNNGREIYHCPLMLVCRVG